MYKKFILILYDEGDEYFNMNLLKKITVLCLILCLFFSDIGISKAYTNFDENDVIEYNLDLLDEESDYLPKQRSVVSTVAKLVLKGGKYVIQFGSKIYNAVSSSVAQNALKNFKTSSYITGNSKFLLTKSDMEHMLVRHHPKFWTGTVKNKQTFFNPNLSISDVNNIALNIAKQNRSIIKSKGTNATFQVSGKVNGIEYVLGFNKGHIKQLYPKK